jgi:hypothetical protein
MQYLEGSGMPVLDMGRTVFKGENEICKRQLKVVTTNQRAA